jgi:hypothetical protein
MNHRRTTIVALSAVLAPLLTIVSPVRSAPPATPTCIPPPSAAPGPIPVEAVPCHSVTPQTDAFASLSWQIFKMIVWPAAKSPTGEPIRGVPDTLRPLSDMLGPRVFETYKPDWETFLRLAAPPLDWPQYAPTASACRNNPPIKPGTLVLSALSEFGNVQEQAGHNQQGQPITNILVAQNGKLARYLVGFDKKEFDLIRTHKLYNAMNLPKLNTPPGPSADAPDGTIIVKSAWIELDGLTVPRDSFYHQRALVQDTVTLDCQEAEVGLVGLHIRYKTPERPQWVWASFEHIQNVPPHASATELLRQPAAYTFNDGAGTPMPLQPPPATLLGSPTFSPHAPPFNVELVKPIPQAIQDINGQWQSALAGTVWANYRLMIVEWPAVGGSPKLNAFQSIPEPPSITDSGANMLNTTLETFLQNAVGPNNGLIFTCMGCHNAVQGLDYTFTIVLDAENSRDMFPSPQRNEVIDYLTSVMSRQWPLDKK